MDLYVYNQNLETQGIIDKYKTFRWVRRYVKCGEFEIVCPLTWENLALLAKGNIVSPKNDDEGAFIYYRRLVQDDEGAEFLTVKGLFLSGYLGRRIVWGNSILKATTAEVVMRTLVTNNCISPTDAKRIIPNLELGELGGFTGNIDYQMAYGNLQEEIETLSETAEIGSRVRFDKINKKLVFETFQGVDRTAGQSMNPRCVFNKKYENILEQDFMESSANYKNVCLVGGKSDDDDTDRRFITIGGDAAGLDRYEIFSDQGGLSPYEGQTKMSDADYDALLTTKGDTTLAAMKSAETFESLINLRSNMTYREDFDLGDKVTCINTDWGIELDARIMEVEENYDENGMEVNVVFGDEALTLTDMIKQIRKG